MSNLVVESGFFDIFPEAEIHTVKIKGINNEKKNEDNFSKMLIKALSKGAQLVPDEEFAENKIIKQWREAFQQFKTKKGTRSSIEALLKRAKQGKELYPINPLVDIYNVISLTYGVPCGAEDLNKISGEFKLGIAKGGEAFLPLGAEEDSPALPEEIIYYDDQGAICRCLNWREAQRTMIDENTKDAILVIEAVYSKQHKQARIAAEKLKEEVENYFGCEAEMTTIKK